MKRLLAAILLIAAIGTATAATCTKDGSVCLDDTPCKIIEGNNVCLADIGATCWNYEDTYTCVKPADQLQCQPFVDAMPDCWQTNSTCIQTDATSGECLKYDQSWQCKDWSMTTPPYVTKLADTITYVKNTVNASSCSPYGSNCVQTSETCIEPAETRMISGIPVTKDCWKWDRSYSCTTTSSADCIAIETDPTCTLTSTTCAALNPDLSCASYNKSYTCSSGTIASGGGDCSADSAPCTTTTTDLPQETYTDGCQETLEATPNTCTRTRDVQVDKDALYKCTSSNNQVQTHTCNKILTVTVDVTACAQGTLLAQFGTYKGDTVQVFCDNTSRVRVQGNFNGWCYNNYNAYTHNAYVSLDPTPVVAQKGQVLYYQKNRCTAYDVDGNCTNWELYTVGPIATMNPGNPVNNVLFGSYYRRGCMVDLQPSTCNGDKTKCTFNFRVINQYNWDDSYYPDIDVIFSTGEVFPTVIYTEHDSWTDQCTTLDARTQ